MGNSLYLLNVDIYCEYWKFQKIICKVIIDVSIISILK